MAMMFEAVKSGGVSAHNFIEDYPNTFRAMAKVNESRLKEMGSICFPIPIEKFADLAKKVGFEILEWGKTPYVSEHETEDILRLIDASTYGKLGWEKAFNEAKEKGIDVKFDKTENGKVKHVSEMVHFILKKP